MKNVTFRAPGKQWEKFNQACQENNQTRGEALREFMQKYITQQIVNQLDQSGEVIHTEKFGNDTITKKIEFVKGPDTYNYSVYNNFTQTEQKVISDHIEDAAEYFLSEI